MIDITNLTSLITAFRQETEQGSISPETLGSLLQAIANLLSAATSDGKFDVFGPREAVSG